MFGENTPKMDYFPEDDNLYLVKSYHGIKMSLGYSSSPKIVVSAIATDGMCGVLEEETKVEVDVSLPDLAVIRLGTLWKNGRYVADAMCSILRRDLEYLPTADISFDFSIDRGKIYRRNSRETATFVNLQGRVEAKSISVFIPSPELLVSAYVPHTLTELSDIVMHPIEDLCRKYLTIKRKDEEGDCKIEAHFKRAFHPETEMFFVYACGYRESRNAVSGLHSSLQEEMTRSSGGPGPFPLEVLPWYPGRCEMNVSGFLDEKYGCFWVQKINYISWDGKCEIFVESPGDKPPPGSTGREEKRGGPGMSRQPVGDDVPVTGDLDPGTKAGMMYTKTQVRVAAKGRDLVHRRRREYGRNASARDREREKEAKAASSGALSGQKASDDIAAVLYRPSDEVSEGEENKDPFHGIPDALELLSKCCPELEIRYLDDEARRYQSRRHCTLKAGKAFDRKRESKWGMMGKRGRYVLVAEITYEDSFAYVVDIEREKEDKFRWLLLLPSDPLDVESLDELKELIVWNRGRYYTPDKAEKAKGYCPKRKGGKELKPRVVEIAEHEAFHHSDNPGAMARRILSRAGFPCGGNLAICEERMSQEGNE